eukprot:CAMPEP_0170142826 /NCGR_PEP_ID=MMETSP0033_2-20121228/8665_1 /TAXON_ID=195969 /ORGANISM="Dolichomastix tenuilepis, Strain CCMP3274" /LENGTH=130 /DNA_ID=CAMNT_0010379203 /DNA_START=196 /DNA_END=585 /DNA_ORIENTATION=-
MAGTLGVRAGGGAAKRFACSRRPAWRSSIIRSLGVPRAEASSQGMPSDGGGESGKKAREKKLADYEVMVISPPTKSLGLHPFLKTPPACGELVEVRGKDYVVSRVVVRYRLTHGKYRRDTSRLDVEETSR